jgi:Retrotransposon gag protein
VEGNPDKAAASSAGVYTPEPYCPSSTPLVVEESLLPEGQPSSSDQKRTLRSQKEHWRLPQEKQSSKNFKETPVETLVFEIPDLGPGELIVSSIEPLPEGTRVRVISTPPPKKPHFEKKSTENLVEIANMEGFEGLAMATWVNNIPEFKGDNFQASPNSVRNFIKKIETVSVTGKWSDEAKISIASIKLKGKALNFENSNKDMLDAIDNHDWNKYKTTLINHFSPRYTEAHLMKRIWDAKQKENELAVEFLARVRGLSQDVIRNKEQETALTTKQKSDLRASLEETVRDAFIDGLQNEVHMAVTGSSEDKTVDELAGIIAKLELRKHPATEEGNRAAATYHLGTQQLGTAPEKGKINVKQLKEDEPQQSQHQYVPRTHQPRQQQQQYQQYQPAPLDQYSRQCQQPQQQFQAAPMARSYQPQQNRYQPNYPQQHSEQPKMCYFCNRTGHNISFCFALKDLRELARQVRLGESSGNNNPPRPGNRYHQPRPGNQQEYTAAPTQSQPPHQHSHADLN